MRFATFTTGASSEPILGVLVNDSTVIDLRAALQGSIDVPARLIDYVWAGPELHARVRAAVEGRTDWPAAVTHPLADVTLRAPLRPGKVIGVGLNSISMVPSAIGPVKAMLRTLDRQKLWNFMQPLLKSPLHTLRPELLEFAQRNGVVL